MANTRIKDLTSASAPTAGDRVAIDGGATTRSITVENIKTYYSTAPAIVGGTIAAVTSFGVRSTGAAFDLKLASVEAISADRTLTVALGNGARTLTMAGDLAIGANFNTTPANSVTLTTTGATNITLPTTGTLATYQEGDWTPNVIGTTTAGTGQTYSLQRGKYQKIGRMVIANFAITATSLGTAAGNARIDGLPFTANATFGGDSGMLISFYVIASSTGTGLMGGAVGGTTQVALRAEAATGIVTLTITNIGATASMFGVLIYDT